MIRNFDRKPVVARVNKHKKMSNMSSLCLRFASVFDWTLSPLWPDVAGKKASLADEIKRVAEKEHGQRKNSATFGIIGRMTGKNIHNTAFHFRGMMS